MLAISLAPPAARAEWVASLVTVGPGDAIWERFGHNMIRVRNTDGRADVVYNWGVFDFNKPNFIGNFVQGRMLYTMQRWPTAEALEEYRQQNRRVYEQRLNFTPEQVMTLLRRCEENARPENADYRYDYFKDNCSTRVRDMLDGVTDGALSKAMKGVPTNPPVTYRYEAMRLMQDDFWASLGADIAIGPNVDKPLDEWADGFLPEAVMKAAATFSEPPQELWPSTRPQPAEAPPTRWPGLLLVGLLWSSLIVFVRYPKAMSKNDVIELVARENLSAGQIRGLAIRRSLSTAPVVLWYLVSGFGGWFFTYVWTITDHTAGHANMNLWHYSPMAWVAVILLAMKRRRAAARIAVLIAGLSVIGGIVWAAGRLFGGPIAQANGQFILLSLPINLAAAFALWRTSLRDAADANGVRQTAAGTAALQ